jgi:hypothetical protein
MPWSCAAETNGFFPQDARVPLPDQVRSARMYMIRGKKKLIPKSQS